VNEQIRKTIIAALYQAMGDDLERAQNAFRNMTREQMQETYGFSEKTRQQIVDGYQAHRDKINEAIKYVEGITS